MTRILVTGATGFIGKILCRELLDADYEVVATTRDSLGKDRLDGVKLLHVPDIGVYENWETSLDGVDVVAHLAGRAHVMKERARDPLAAFRKVNTEGTERLANAAAKSGVKRIVYLSTIKVNGGSTSFSPFTEEDPPAPQDAYALSKWEAEQALFGVAENADLEAVVIRPPLVYGEGVKGNFLSLLKICKLSLPLPLGGAANQRSLIYVGNLVDIIIKCLEHPGAAGQVFLARDGEDLSTAELIRRLAGAMERPARLFSVPKPLLGLAGGLTGKKDMVSRLLDSLSVDDGKIRRKLGWVPPYAMEQGLSRTAAWFLSL